MKNIFEEKVTNEMVDRINKLTPETQPGWGKMNGAQMLAHCSVAYDLAYDEKAEKAKGIKLFLLKAFVKSIVVGEKPYKKNGRTSPTFLVQDERDFLSEKQRLLDNLSKTLELGEKHFDNKESQSFGKLTVKEWSNMFYKHLDHHLNQFGV